jgi:hypothetical protein
MSKKRTMVIREHREIEYESDKSEDDKMLALKNYSDVEYLINREVLVIRRSLNVQIKKDDMSKKKKKKRTYFNIDAI